MGKRKFEDGVADVTAVDTSANTNAKNLSQEIFDNLNLNLGFNKDLVKIIMRYISLRDMLYVSNNLNNSSVDVSVTVNDYSLVEKLNRHFPKLDELRRVLSSCQARLSGSSLLKVLTETDQYVDSPLRSPTSDYKWSGNDYDFFILDKHCDELMETPLDKYLIQELVPKRNESVASIDPTYACHVNNDYKNTNTIIGHYYGPITQEMKTCSEYSMCDFQGSGLFYGRQLTFPNVWRVADDIGYYSHLPGVVAQRKYVMSQCSIDVICIDSKVYDSVDAYISEHFDFDFLKNSWDGSEIKIMRPYHLINKSSRYQNPFDSTRGRMYHNYLVDTEAYIVDQGHIEVDNLNHVDKRKKLYTDRGFKILD